MVDEVRDTDPLILVVDDEPAAVQIITRILTRAGYSCETAGSVPEAKQKLAALPIGLVLSDVNMPGESGIDLLASHKDRDDGLATVMVSGMDDRELADRALQLGAYGYVIKPVHTNELLISVSNALRRRDLELENRNHRERLEQMVQERTAHLWNALRDLEQTRSELEQTQERSIAKLVVAAEYRDMKSVDQVEHMSRYCALLADKAGLDGERIRLIRPASLMHDVGKMAIPERIVLKLGRLSEDEWETMKTHAEIGHQILDDDSSPLLQVAALIALTHHEKVDGSGYPRGLKGDEIPIEGRLAAIADVFDALTTNRPYRRAFPFGEALEILKNGRGSHFDADLLDAFLDSMDEVLAIKDPSARRGA